MPELVIYNTVGFPDPDSFTEFIRGAARYADVIELGIPPKFAKYDGPTIRKSYSVASRNGSDYFEMIRNVSSYCRIVALSYLDDLDLEPFLNKIRSTGAKAVLFPDLLIDHMNELDHVTAAVKEKSLNNVIFVSPSVPDSIMRSASLAADEFVYLGVRPTTGVPTPININNVVKRTRRIIQGKLIAGFGLKDNLEIAQAISGGADGVAIGTSIMKVLEEKGVEEALEVTRRLKEYVGSL
ncbi:MAG: tryptophan synthase subunit alpha [Nitrososphaeria archaeon]